MPSVLLVSGDFTPWGGMDHANYEFARYLAEETETEVHIAAHFVASPLDAHPKVRWRRVPRPLGSHALGSPCLAWEGKRLAASLPPGSRVIVNGGNCAWPDVTWVHALHAAWKDDASHASRLFRLRSSMMARLNRRNERRTLGMVNLILANSEQTRQDIIHALGVPPGKVHTVYYGIDAGAFRPPTASERAAARLRLGLPADRPVAAFVGAISPDRRKGFDILFDAWSGLCADPSWDADLLAVGTGGETGLWSRKAAASGLDGRIRILGFSKQVADLLAACDLLVSPTRYEAYGLAVHEALCRGLPSLVTRSAGVAERYPEDLRGLLLEDPPRADELSKALRAWRADIAGFRARTAPFGAALRQRSWTDMSREIAGLLAASAGKGA